jgi:REP element-mobilizing transposase RayT
MARGIEGMNIFSDNSDRYTFINLLEKYLAASECRCYAWALMNNHYHLIVATGDLHLSELMKPLNSKYATYFNKKYLRRGYLFQDRFKSIASQDQLYCEEMVRYVHLNPIRAGIIASVDELDRFPWSGHSALMGYEKRPFQDIQTILRRFGKNRNDARMKYRKFLGAGLTNPENDAVVLIRESTQKGRSGNDPRRWVIGDSDFIRKAIHKANQKRLNISRFAVEGWNMEKVVEYVGSKIDIAPSLIRIRTRGGLASEGRKISAFLAYRELGFPLSEIARYYQISGVAVSKMIPSGKEYAARRKILLSY